MVEVELEMFNNEGVDQSTESVDNSFVSLGNSEAEVGVEEEASVEVSVDEESNRRWADSQIIVSYISPSSCHKCFLF